MKNQDIRNLSYQQLIDYLKDIGEPSFRADQIFSWLYKKGVSSYSSMTNLKSRLKEQLERDLAFERCVVSAKDTADDKTTKFVFELSDAQHVEAVLIPARGRMTACISTQVGCKYHCQFCASGIGGWKRNLTTAEIISQVQYLKRVSDTAGATLSHIVFMGTGEPLDNYANVLKAIRIINGKKGFCIAARRITVSTCGIPEKIRLLAKEGIQVELAISLHVANDKTRTMVMPVNKKYPLKDLLDTCRQYIKETNRQITFEYILIRDVTCTQQAAKELARLLKGMLCKVNLIPYNFVEEFSFNPVSYKDAREFKGQLESLGIIATLRHRRGSDVSAACGQLRRSIAPKHQEEKP